MTITNLSVRGSDIGLSQESIDRFPGIEAAVLHAGEPRFEEFGEITLTYTNEQVLEVSKMIPEATMVPLHMDSWMHFKQGPTRCATRSSRPE